MCQYLFAEFSLKAGVAEGLTSDQADAVDRWRKTLRGIAVEEMLHIALVANLKSGGRHRAGARSSQLPAAVGVLPQRGPARPAAVRRRGARSLPVSRAPRGHGPSGRRGVRLPPHPHASPSTSTRPCPGGRSSRPSVISTAASPMGCARSLPGSVSERCSSAHLGHRPLPSSSDGHNWSRSPTSSRRWPRSRRSSSRAKAPGVIGTQRTTAGSCRCARSSTPCVPPIRPSSPPVRCSARSCASPSTSRPLGR